MVVPCNRDNQRHADRPVGPSLSERALHRARPGAARSANARSDSLPRILRRII